MNWALMKNPWRDPWRSPWRDPWRDPWSWVDGWFEVSVQKRWVNHWFESVGSTVGLILGSIAGASLGLISGSSVGSIVGSIVGLIGGSFLGLIAGWVDCWLKQLCPSTNQATAHAEQQPAFCTLTKNWKVCCCQMKQLKVWTWKWFEKDLNLVAFRIGIRIVFAVGSG